MFYKLVMRNSRRNRKENGLFFSSLLISVIAFYIILSLPKQDVMLFLTKMESDAVNRLMSMIPLFYGMTLVILFFLIYYASKFQLERRRHELGVYLMMGMQRKKLFFMLLLEDLHSTVLSLLIGLPAAILLSELISLITSRLVGLGIIGHQSSFSFDAVIWTTLGFFIIKLAAFLLLSQKITRQEIGKLLVDTPEGTKKQKPVVVYAVSLFVGIFFLFIAYAMAIKGISWTQIPKMFLTMLLILIGTFLLFYGLRYPVGLLAKHGKKHLRLQVFNFRQLEENIIHRSNTLAVSSLLILAALCCFGAGTAIAHFHQNSEPHVLDYTFPGSENNIPDVLKTLKETGLDREFSSLFEMKIGYIRTTKDFDNAFDMTSVMTALAEKKSSKERDTLQNNLSYATYPHLISLSGYNRLLSAANLPTLTLKANEAAVHMNAGFVTEARVKLLNSILEEKPAVQIDEKPFHLCAPLQTNSPVTDRSITLSFALILPDDAFEFFTQGDYDIYLNGVLKNTDAKNAGLMSAISKMNQKLNQTGFFYESYLQNMGRQLFYMVAASYITIYLAIIFMIVSNTILGVQFLMSQQKARQRYKTLIHLGASYETLCRSCSKQIRWYFAIPTVVAAINSFFGVRALFTGLLSSTVQGNIRELLFVSGGMILLLCVIEYLYMSAVRHSANRYLFTLMVPEREE